MTWEEICADPVLAGLPFRIETDKWGRIVMSPPAGADHSDYQSEILILLHRLMPAGKPRAECPVQTADGVKAIDVAWMSDARFQQRPAESIVYLVAPEICVEVRSPSNSFLEVTEKMGLYFQEGAIECWVCDRVGLITFLTADGPVPKSGLCPEFPTRINRTDSGWLS